MEVNVFLLKITRGHELKNMCRDKSFIINTPIFHKQIMLISRQLKKGNAAPFFILFDFCIKQTFKVKSS